MKRMPSIAPGLSQGQWVAALAGGLLAATASSACADEPLFGNVNATDLLPKAKMQVEQWVGFKTGNALGGFHAQEGRTEFDYGLTSSVQVTGYLNYSDLHAAFDQTRTAPLGLPAGPSVSRRRFDGVTGEVIWRLWSPYLDPVGVALLADGTAGPGQRAFGLKAIVQKNFLDDTLVTAANLRVDLGLQEKRPVGDPLAGRRRVTPIEAAFGASYRFRPGWSAAVEARARRRYAEDLPGGASWEHSDLFAGPTLHYGGERWYATLSALHRLQSDNRPAASAVERLVYARDQARWDSVRLRVGRTF